MNCTKGTVDVSNFSKPMPIIGLYIAGATLLCIIQMARDLVSGFKSKQIWIPAKNFSIDAASLTIIGIAIKLSVDLNSPMPSKIDQLAKLATSAFICTVLANILPSLGKLEKGELLANTIALAILIITSLVNLCIQLNTGVIQAFRNAHIVVITITCLLLFYTLLYVAPALQVIKNRLQLRFEKLHRNALKELHPDSNENIKVSRRMEEYLNKFSMMAQSGCPHFFLCRSWLYYSFLSYGSMAALALFFVLFATIAHNDNMVGLNTCSGKSDYGWSVVMILLTQIIAVVVGWVAALCKMVYIFRIPDPISSPPRNPDEKPVQRLNRTTEDLLLPFIQHRLQSPFLYYMKLVLRLFFLGLRDKSAFYLTNASPFGLMEKTGLLEKMFKRKTRRTSSNTSNVNESDKLRLRPYFLHLEIEDSLTRIERMVLSCSRVTQIYLDSGKKRKPQKLINFLKKYPSSDVERVYWSDGPPNCWALPLLTLTCIAIALPNIDETEKEELRESVIEGLVYVKLVEDNLNANQDLVNIRAAANLVWEGLDKESSWIYELLPGIANNSRSPTEVHSLLAQSAKKSSDSVGSSETQKTSDRKKKHSDSSMDKDSIWKEVADSIGRIRETLLPDCQNEQNDKIFKKVCNTIADILGACFTNLRNTILLECMRSTIEKRRETAFRMLTLFGETEMIMDILEEDGRKIPDLPEDEMAFIDKRRSYRTCQQTKETEEESRTQGDDLGSV